ncbi:LysR family transcriptional regulator [Aquabacterium sp.]|uniref:LysR family transcriptional regulator n=1 Tax=Aquabacterium sp. TaxID=1872578 RepID=UPI002B6B605B|nr:LysR family transcriptional regulator [Aquabacterium sp.]HSW06776.1 LysR family transcriptional regulator [Aquabacterium sp.]
MSTPAASLEQLRAFAAVVDAGGFSAAARQLKRSQPVVSYLVANLEAHLGFSLFERGRRRPVLTERGAALVPHARRICQLSDVMEASAENLRRDAESALSLAVDPLFPCERLGRILAEFAQRHPAVPVTLRSPPMGAVLDLVLSNECTMGISVMRFSWPDAIEPREFGSVDFLPVAAPTHPLAGRSTVPSETEVREHVQLVLLDTGERTKSLADYSIMGLHTWRVTDLALKLALLRAGVGWGHMPLHLVADDLAQGRLVKLRMPTLPGGQVGWTLIHRADSPPGPMRQWLAERLIAWD